MCEAVAKDLSFRIDSQRANDRDKQLREGRSSLATIRRAERVRLVLNHTRNFERKWRQLPFRFDIRVRSFTQDVAIAHYNYDPNSQLEHLSSR
jgi:hypothetical protein